MVKKRAINTFEMFLNNPPFPNMINFEDRSTQDLKQYYSHLEYEKYELIQQPISFIYVNLDENEENLAKR
jgi:hypothetical protein